MDINKTITDLQNQVDNLIFTEKKSPKYTSSLYTSSLYTSSLVNYKHNFYIFMSLGIISILFISIYCITYLTSKKKSYPTQIKYNTKNIFK